MKKPLIAIVGRPNVGKSTLFNRLVGRRAAVVTDMPGTTRDRIALDAEWEGRPFIIVDTGGFETKLHSPLVEEITAQIEMAIQAADAIIFVTDVRDGLTPVDQEVSKRLRYTDKPVTLAVNKSDNPILYQGAVDFYSLGFGDPMPISAHHNLGIDDLMAVVLAATPMGIEADVNEEVLPLAIVGRVNVGKSAFLNAILGEDRTIVSEIPGTTRDAIDTPVLYQGQKILLIDTAGIRRRGKVVPGIERYSVLRSIQAIDRAEVTFLTLDASDLVAAQDTHIAGEVADAFKGSVIVVNKWDLAEELDLDQSLCLSEIRRRFKFMPYTPIRFISAMKNQGIMEAMDAALMVHHERRRLVSQQDISAVVMSAMSEHPLPNKGRRSLRLSRVVQEGVSPPTFVFYVNEPELVHFSYRRYLEKKLRFGLGFRWSHLKLVFQKQSGRRAKE